LAEYDAAIDRIVAAVANLFVAVVMSASFLGGAVVGAKELAATDVGNPFRVLGYLPDYHSEKANPDVGVFHRS